VNGSIECFSISNSTTLVSTVHGVSSILLPRLYFVQPINLSAFSLTHILQ
jgi:F0F1-type ATP synthase assembly protein I